MEHLFGHHNYTVIVILLMIGLYAMIAKRNLFKKVIGMVIFQTAIIYFFIGSSVKRGSTIPIIQHGAHGGDSHHGEALHGAAHAAIDPALYTNPLPHVLMLTAIVVGVAVLGVALVLIERLFEEYGTSEEDEILEQLQ